MDDPQLTSKYEKMRISGQVPYNSDEKLIIALDFGTTFSGIAYCYASQRNPKVATIVVWPGAQGESAPKVPTLINYGPKDKETFSWGAAVDRTQNTIVGVKLFLDPDQERPLYLPTGNIKQNLKNLPKDPVSVAADFIRAIYEHALSEIIKTVPSGYYELCQKEFVLSVPAVWSDAAKNATLTAAKMAGISPVTLIKEPEAAALYTLHSMDFAIQEGHVFVVCDAGGGTVDLISYEVVGLKPTLQVKEPVSGTGGMAGSLGLNQRFAEAVKNLVGDDQFHELKKTQGFSLAEKQFDREVKRSFHGDAEEEYIINFSMADLEDDEDSGLKSDCWRITGKDLKAIFAPLITNILWLIDDQIKSVKIKRQDSGVTGIILVGGFGSSQYLKSCVEKQHPDIQVLQPNDAWAAIVKGAALSQLPGHAVVTSTCATKHYGVSAWWNHDPGVDFGVPINGNWLDSTHRSERMTWYINIGDDIQRDQKIKFPFFRDVQESYSPNNLIFEDVLYHCEDPQAPLHPSKGGKLGKNCTLTSDLRAVPRDRFAKMCDKNGKNYFRVAYDLIVSLESALMTFSLEIDGKKMGSVEAKF